MLTESCRRVSAVALGVLLLGLVSLSAGPLLDAPSAVDAGPMKAGGYAPGTGFDYGAVASDPARVRDMGFRWMKIYLRWRDIQPTRTGPMQWGFVDSWIAQIRSTGVKVLALVFDPPEWARSTPNAEAPPANDQDLADFMVAAAIRYRGQIAAYELWNEPNLTNSWGKQPPDPARYARMLRTVYPQFKAADPNALLVTGGLATAGDQNSAVAMGDLLYIKYLYRPDRPADPAPPCSDPGVQAALRNGARGFFDALAVHPYGGPWAPDAPPSQVQYSPPGNYFRRAEQARQMVEVWGCDDVAIFVTEFGWLVQPGDNGVPCTLDGYFNPFVVSQDQKARYLRQAYEYARQNWPWMGPMFLMNLDFAVGWGPSMECTLGGWSVLKRDGSPSPAYTELKNMPKAAADNATPRLSPNQLTLLAERATPAQALITILNAAFLPTTNWTASTNQSWLQVQVLPGGIIAVTATASSLSVGTYSGTVTVRFPGLSAAVPGAQETYQVPVSLSVLSRLYRSYLPNTAVGSGQ